MAQMVVDGGEEVAVGMIHKRQQLSSRWWKGGAIQGPLPRVMESTELDRFGNTNNSSDSSG